MPPENRRPDVPWGVHVVVAPLTAEAQVKWLATAAAEEWNASELSRVLRALRLNGGRRRRAGEKPPDLKRGVDCPTCGRPW